MKERFYVIKFSSNNYWEHNSGDKQLVRGSVGSPLQATHISKKYSKYILPKIQEIIKEAKLVEINVEYTEKLCKDNLNLNED